MPATASLVRRARHIDYSRHKVTAYADVDRFLAVGEMPAGVLCVGGVLPIDMHHVPSDGPTMVVCFHAALVGEVRLPFLTGAGVTADLPASRLSLSDPTLYLSDDLALSWYAGSRHQPDLQDRLAQVVRHTATVTGARHLVFFGASGGGFAALEMAHRFPGSLALVMNPQTSILRYHPEPVARYTATAWGGTMGDTARADLADVYATDADVTVAYMQNATDTFHIDNHLAPFLSAHADQARVHTLMGEWGEGHVVPPKDLIRSVLTAAVAANGKWSGALDGQGFTAQA